MFTQNMYVKTQTKKLMPPPPLFTLGNGFKWIEKKLYFESFSHPSLNEILLEIIFFVTY